MMEFCLNRGVVEAPKLIRLEKICNACKGKNKIKHQMRHLYLFTSPLTARPSKSSTQVIWQPPPSISDRLRVSAFSPVRLFLHPPVPVPCEDVLLAVLGPRQRRVHLRQGGGQAQVGQRARGGQRVAVKDPKVIACKVK